MYYRSIVVYWLIGNFYQCESFLAAMLFDRSNGFWQSWYRTTKENGYKISRFHLLYLMTRYFLKLFYITLYGKWPRPWRPRFFSRIRIIWTIFIQGHPKNMYSKYQGFSSCIFFTREVSRFSRIWTSATPQAAMFFDSYLNNISFALPVYVSEKVWLNLTQRLQTRCHLKILTNAWRCKVGDHKSSLWT